MPGAFSTRYLGCVGGELDGLVLVWLEDLEDEDEEGWKLGVINAILG